MNTKALAFLVAASLGTAVGFAAACTETTAAPGDTTARSQQPTPANRVASPDGESATTPAHRRLPVTAAEFHRNNRMDWVGAMHNHGLDVFRAELRAHKLRSMAQLCRDVVDLALRDSLQHTEHRQMSAQQRRAVIVDGLSETPGCHDLASRASPAMSTTPGTAIVRLATFAPTGMSSMSAQDASVESLLGEMSYAVANASDPNALASRLDQITSSAAALDPVSQSAVLGAASLALSSVEYWNANYASFQSEIADEYGCSREVLCEEPYSVLGSASRRQFWSGAWRAARSIGGYDLAAGSAVIMKTWLAGPIGWEAAGDAALIGSAIGAVGYAIQQIQQT
jgi:hypothetical protein